MVCSLMFTDKLNESLYIWPSDEITCGTNTQSCRCNERIPQSSREVTLHSQYTNLWLAWNCSLDVCLAARLNTVQSDSYIRWYTAYDLNGIPRANSLYCYIQQDLFQPTLCYRWGNCVGWIKHVLFLLHSG